MVNPTIVAKASGKAGLHFFTPFGKINTIITIACLLFLVIYSSVEAVKQKDIYPLYDGILFKTLGADHKISQSLDEINPVLAEDTKFFDVFNSRWWAKAWATFLLWFDILIAVWFMYIIIFALYKLFQGLNNTNPLMNVGYAIIIFVLLQVIVGLALYPTILVSGKGGYPLQNNSIDLSSCYAKSVNACQKNILNDAFVHSYPFEGMVKLIKRIATSSLFDKTYAFLLSDSGQLSSNIPTSYINETGING